jgi:hypothetical protein
MYQNLVRDKLDLISRYSSGIPSTTDGWRKNVFMKASKVNPLEVPNKVPSMSETIHHFKDIG